MPVIVVGAEKNLAALRSRLFSGRVSNHVVHDVTEAIAAANPHVDLKALQPGTVLTVPDHPRVAVQGDLSVDEASRQALDGVTQAGIQALEQLSATAKSRAREAAAEGKALARLLSGRDLAAELRKDRELAADVGAVREAAAAEDANAKQRAAAFEEARSEWTRELNALSKLVP